MKKLAKDMNVLTDAELYRMMLTLEAAHAETGNKNVLNVMSIIMPSQDVAFIKSNQKYPTVRDCSKCIYKDINCNDKKCYDDDTKEHGYYIKAESNMNIDNLKPSDKCPRCGTRHPLVKEFKYCGECARIMYE